MEKIVLKLVKLKGLFSNLLAGTPETFCFEILDLT